MAVTVGASKTFGGTEHSTSQNSNLVRNPCFVIAIFGFLSESFHSGHSLTINYSEFFCKLQFPSFCTRSLLWKLSSHIFFASWHTGSSKERMATIRRMMFQKSSKWPLSQRLWPPPLFFRKKMLQFFFFFKFHAQKVLFKGPKSATWIFGLKMTLSFGSFPKVHPFCQVRPSLIWWKKTSSIFLLMETEEEKCGVIQSWLLKLQVEWLIVLKSVRKSTSDKVAQCTMIPLLTRMLL